MGASESAAIKVSFNRSNLFYFGGEKISGNISFQNINDKLTLEEAILELIGELVYTSQETRWHHNNNGRSHKEHYTEYHHVSFLNIRVSVVRPVHGKSKLTLHRGSHSWPFEVFLPDSLPPTLVPSAVGHPYVKYYARIILDKPWYAPDTVPIYPLTICPRVNLLHMSGTQEPVTFAHHNRKKVELQGCLLRGGIVPGQYLSIRVDLQNPKQSKIKHIEATFVQHRQIANIRDHQIIFRNNLPGVYKFEEPILQQNFDLLVPAEYLAPTYAFFPSGEGAPLGIIVHYELILSVKTSGIFTDFQVSIPVVVGTDSAPQAQHQQQWSDQFAMSAAGGTVFNKEDLPPSYAMAVRNEK